MNGNALIRILATFGLLIVSLWVSFDIFTSGSNAVARFYMYVMVVAGVYGLLNARRAFFVLLFLTAYLDYFKRFMIFDSGLSRMDLYYVLGIAPATLAGITGNILYQHFTGKLSSRAGTNKLIMMTLAATGIATFLALTSGGGGYRSLGDTVNSTIYLLLLFVVPVLFRTPEDLRGLLKVLVIMYVPAVCYMIVHFFHGVFDWEMEYLKSGLTIEVRQLSERVLRPFGTMNSAANASMVFAGIFALCASGLWRTPSVNGRVQSFGLRWLLLPLIMLAMYATLSRTGWVFAVIAVLAVPFVKRRTLTFLGYLMTFASLVTVVFASGYLLRHKILNLISEDMYMEQRTDLWAQTTNISTLNDRLEGYSSLVSQPRAWSPFGLRFSTYSESAVLSTVATHDMITTMLMSYGYVTLLLAGIFVMWQLWKLHTFIFYEPEQLARSIAATCMAIGLALTSGATVNGAQFSTYPVNFFIWFNFAVVTSLVLYAKERDALKLAAGTAESPSRMLREPAARGATPARQGPIPVPAHAKA